MESSGESSRMFDTDAFIAAVREREALYNTKHENHTRKDIRIKLWDEIGQIMFPNWENLDAREKNEKGVWLQRKWKSLKDCFNREIRQQKYADPKKYRKKYELYDKLTFLLVNSTDPKPIKPATNPPAPEVQKPKYELESKPIRVIPQAKKMKLDDGEKKSEEDGDRLFLLSFVSDLKRLPLPTKYWVKMKFSEIMQQATMSLNEFQECSYSGDVFQFERHSPTPSDVSQTDVKIPSPSSSSDIYIHQDN